MNTQSPLIPQGSLLEQKNKGRARVRIAVFVVLAIHGIGLLALLMQGCKKEPEATPAPEQAETNAMPAFAEPTNALPLADATTNVPATTNPPAIEPVPVPPILPTPAATEYKVVAGDTFTSIAKKFHVTTRAITEANPGVDPTRLKIDQALHIPAPVPPSLAGTNAPSPLSGTAAQIHTVKSGETLTSIAARYGVTIRALRSANHLTTDRIVVGQKLTIPAKASSPSSGTAPTNGGTGTSTPQ